MFVYKHPTSIIKKAGEKRNSMKRLLHNILYVLIFTIIILLSYTFIEKYIIPRIPEDIYYNLIHYLKFGEGDKQKNDSYHAVWLSYLEFDDYRNSVDVNNSENFSKYYQHVLDRCRELHMDHIIVQVRPFGDALYKSDYFPWARCISGSQGRDPGYDPLEIMVDLTHKSGMKIEAWINPYRVSSSDDIMNLAEDNQARIWGSDPLTSRNVLVYDEALYYNPSSKTVQELIINGVDEIVRNYNVDGIHMDDYFYPIFEDDYAQAFDAQEYNEGIKNGKIPKKLSLADWRRKNVNTLIAQIYKTVKKEDKSKTFGISPAGNPEDLMSDYEHYVDIKTWLRENGYIDYIMPQIYWGYTNEISPFAEILQQWTDLCKGSRVTLYAGLQLYRLGSEDNEGSSDYEELQSADLIIKQLEDVKNNHRVKGFSLFSYQYLDADCNEYDFESTTYSKKRKEILRDVSTYLK